jgi:hypothetical protein
MVCSIISGVNYSNKNSCYDKDTEFYDENYSLPYTSSSPPNIGYFKYYKEITINHLKVADDLTNFPMLISIYDSDLHTEVQANGADIAFSNGSNWLDHEIEDFKKDYNGTHAQLVAWVRIPSLSSSIDTKIYMYYGNSTMGSRQNPSGVWNPSFKGVWHLNTTLLDSTSNDNDGTNSVPGPDDGPGYIANGRDYGITDYSNMGSGASIDNVFNGGATVSVWIYPEGWGGADFGRILDKATATSGANGWVICLDGGVSPWYNQLLFYRGFSTNRGLWMSGDNTIAINEWHHIVITYDDSSVSNDPSIYINGVLESGESGWEDDTPGGTASSDAAQSVYIGNFKDGGRGFDGGIDEVRVISGIKSNQWIQTEYNNQYNPNTFYTVSSSFEIDKIPPDITINLPTNNDLFGNTAPNFNVEINDNSSINSRWYRLLNGTVTTINTTFTTNGTISQERWNEIGNGTVTIQFFANDSLGNEGFSEITVRKDIHSPIINVNIPNDLDLLGDTAPTFNVDIQDINTVDSMWYTLNDGVKTFFILNETISQTLWNGCGNGSVSIKFYANDSLGNQGFSEVVVRKDIIYPIIVINTPDPFDLYGRSAPSYNVRITDPNGISFMWYTLNDGSKTFFTTNGTISQVAWNNFGSESISVKFCANDSLGNEDFLEVVVQKDLDGPNVTINSPIPNSLFGEVAPSFNIGVVDVSGINLMWYTIDGGLTNITFMTNGTISQGIWQIQGNGTVTIKFYARDTVGNEGFSEVTVRKDIDPPTIIINNPTPDQQFGIIGPTFNVEITDINGIDTMWYSLDGGITNTIFTLNGSISQIVWDNFGDGEITLRFYANNSIGSIGFSEVSIIKDIYAPSIIINTPNNNSYCNEAPIININALDINLDKLWCRVAGNNISLMNSEDFQLNSSIWDSLPEGYFQIYLFANDTLGHVNDTIILTLCKDTINPNAPILLTYPSGEVSLPIVFDWEDGVDTSGIAYYRLIIDNEADPFATPGFVFEVNITNTGSTSSYYELLEYLTPRNYYFFIYQIDAAENQGSAVSGTFTIAGAPEAPSEFPWWIILIIAVPLGLAVVIVALKKSKKNEIQVVIIDKELDKLKQKRNDLDAEAKIAFKANNYIKAADIYEECVKISYDLYNEGDKLEEHRYKSFKALELDARSKAEATPLRNACINNVLTKFFDDNAIKYYSNPQIYPENQETINGLILNDNNFLQNRFTELDDSLDLTKELDMDPTNLGNINAIQVLFSIDFSIEAIINYCQKYQNPEMILLIVGLEWPAYNYGERINLPADKSIKYPKNIKIVDLNLFSRIFLINEQCQKDLQNIINLHYDFDSLNERFEATRIALHDTPELKDELKQKGWFFLI